MIKQNPFSLYDFLGYFIPGVLLLDSLIFISNSDFSKLEFSITAFILNDDNLNFQNILFFIIICYVLGHFINFISSIFVERFANWIYDYSSKYLLQIQKKFNFKTITPKRIFIWVIIMPVSILDLLLGQLLKVRRLYTNSLDPLLVHCIKQKGLILINRHFKRAGNEELKNISEYDFFRIFHHYVFEHSKNHQFKMSNYVVLYGFLRSLTMISVVIFLVSFIFKVC